VPALTNIGQICCTHVAQKSSQSVLSLKHLDMNAEVEGVVLDGYARKYLKAGVDENSYLLAPDLETADSVKLIVPVATARGLTDVRDVMIVSRNGMEEAVRVPVKRGNRNASFTHDMLEHIKQQGWEMDKNHNYVIDMEEWNWMNPILTLPLRHYNMSDHSAAMARMLESTVKEEASRDQMAPEQFLQEFDNLVNDKLNVMFAVNEIIVLGVSIRSAKGDDYRLPKPGTDYGLGVRSNIMMYRSLSAAMAFQGHRDIILSPSSYVVRYRPPHPLDAILMPAEKFNNTY
jgi:hypothetical protein